MDSHEFLLDIKLKSITLLRRLRPTCNLEVRVSISRVDGLKTFES